MSLFLDTYTIKFDETGLVSQQRNDRAPSSSASPAGVRT